MNKDEYLKALEHNLQSLTENDRQEALIYYKNYFEDAGEENFQQIITQLGSPEQLAKSILHNYPGVLQVTQKKDDKNNNATNNSSKASNKSDYSIGKILFIILLVLITMPLWIPAIGVISSIVLGIAITIVAIGAISTILGTISFIVGICFFCLGVFFIFPNGINALMFTGLGLVLIGISIIFSYFGIYYCVKTVPAIIRKFVELCQRALKSNNKEKAKWKSHLKFC